MVTPFGGGKIPVQFNLLDQLSASTGIIGTALQRTNSATASIFLDYGMYIDFSRFSGGTWTGNMVFGHADMSTAGNMIVQIVNITNSSSALATGSSNVSTDNSLFRQAIATTIVITAPTVASKIGILMDNRDSSVRVMYIFEAKLWWFP